MHVYTMLSKIFLGTLCIVCTVHGVLCALCMVCTVHFAWCAVCRWCAGHRACLNSRMPQLSQDGHDDKSNWNDLFWCSVHHNIILNKSWEVLAPATKNCLLNFLFCPESELAVLSACNSAHPIVHHIIVSKYIKKICVHQSEAVVQYHWPHFLLRPKCGF